jgi:hypothetical protein
MSSKKHFDVSGTESVKCALGDSLPQSAPKLQGYVRSIRGAGSRPSTPGSTLTAVEGVRSGRPLRLDHPVHGRSGQGGQTDSEQVVAGDALRGSVQARFRGAAPVRETERWDQRLRWPVHPAAWARWSNEVTEAFGEPHQHCRTCFFASNSKSRHLGRSHSIFWVFSGSGGMVKVARASRKTGQEGKIA